MTEGPVTASAVVRYATELENQSAAFYRALAARFSTLGQTYEGFAQDCEKSAMQIQRTYQETVTDALETGFAFPGLSLGAYALDVDLPEGIRQEEAAARALALEERALAFYEQVGEQSASLLAAIGRAFKRAARVRRRRKGKLL